LRSEAGKTAAKRARAVCRTTMTEVAERFVDLARKTVDIRRTIAIF
jgi:hypothetical protein